MKGDTVGSPPSRHHLAVDDSFWTWLDSPETPMHVAALAIFESDAEPADLVARRIATAFRNRTDMEGRFRTLIRARRFPRRARLHAAGTVEIDYHLLEHTLPAPGGEDELAQLISHLHSMALDERRPMWEVHVIAGLQHNRFAVYLKVHHALINGVDAVRLLARSLATDAGSRIPDPVWALRRTAHPGPDSADNTARPSRFRVLITSLRAAARLWRAGRTDSPLVGPFQAPRSPLNSGDVAPDRRVCTASIELDRVKLLSKLSRSTVNDVVLAVCSAALRRYLLDIGGLPASPLVIGCPTSIKASPGSSRSSVGIMFVDSATDQSDPGIRLSVISRSTTAAKAHLATLPHEALVSHSILAMAPHTLRQLIPRAVGRCAPMFNMIISNVPGPDRPRYLAGARMVALYPLSLLFRGEGLNITAVSYDGRMHLGFTAGGPTLSQVHLFTRYLETAMDELENHYATVIPDLGRPA